ncbi:hypothetical protein [Pseudomonas sp. p1(2021b)]|uniref:hypothetical protein n=1 Tax=Pseudomonas sp. p1(2021b) TaxID=2874628 RepID=UPI003D2B42E1
MREIEAQAKALAPVFSRLLEQAKTVVRQELADQLKARDNRISELEKALDERPSLEEIAKAAAALIPEPEKGEDADMEALEAHLEALVKGLPKPQDGRSVAIEDVAPLIREEVAKSVEALPKPADGRSVTVDDVRPLLSEMIDSAVKALPTPEKGKDADMDALKSHLGELVKAIELPKPPSIEEFVAPFERRFSDLTLSWERQARDTFEKAADRMPVPKDGEKGRDAFPLESFELELGEDGRTVTVKLQAGESIIEKSVKIPTVIDRGVFSADKPYEQGDGVTYGGCYWLAQKDAPEGVPGGSADWRMAVKKGRDGKDLRDNASRHDPSKGVSIR